MDIKKVSLEEAKLLARLGISLFVHHNEEWCLTDTRFCPPGTASNDTDQQWGVAYENEVQHKL